MTDEDIERAVDSAGKVAVEPGSHFAVLLDDEVTEVNADGSSKRMVTIVRQALNENGRDTLIQAKLPGFGRVKVLDAYSVKHGSDRQEASSVSNALVRFRSLDIGSIVVLRYVHYSPAGRFLPNEFATEWYFQNTDAQTERSRWKLITAKGRDLRVAIQGKVKSSVETVGDQDVHTFSAEHMPPLTPEPGMPNQKDSLARVSVSTLKDWAPYVRWEKAILADVTGESDEIKELAKKLTSDAQTPKEKLDHLWAYVAEEVRYQQEYETTIAGVKPHPSRVVLERGYGDCKDKALLLQSLAKAVGIDLRFALLKTTPYGRVEKEIPNQQFNHAINYVPAQPGFEQGFFLDSTTNGLDVGNLRTDDQGAISLVLGGDKDFEFLQIPYQSADLEYEKHHLSIDLKDPATARANDRLDVRGTLASSFRLAVRNPEGAKKLYHSLSDRLFSGTTLLSGDSDKAQDITTPLVVHLDTDVTNSVQKEGDEGRFTIPLQFPLARATVLTTRKLAVGIDRGTVSSQIEIDLPGPSLHKPQAFSVQHSCFTIERTVTEKGSHLSISTTYKSTCSRVDPSEYEAFRAAVQKVLAHQQDSVGFRLPKAGK